MALEYVIYADESEKNGLFYSDFYGGALVRSTDLQAVQARLQETKTSLGFHGEVKWRKVTEQYLAKYVALMDCFFDMVAADKIKVRIMFTQNLHVPAHLTPMHTENRYFLLYYQFIKHAFGLTYSNMTREAIPCRLIFDKLPDTREKIAAFRGYLAGLSRSPEFRRARVRIPWDSISEVRSHDHVIIQCLDVALGAMQFRLNDKHLAKPPGARVRARKTRAKETLYKHICARVRTIYPGFNIGISTGTQGDPTNRWLHSYRHWLFIPNDHVRDAGESKT